MGPMLLDFFFTDAAVACGLAELLVVEVGTMPLEASVAAGGAPLVEGPEEVDNTWGAGLLAVFAA